MTPDHEARAEWRDKYIARMVACGVSQEHAVATYEAGEDFIDYTDDPEQAADEELSYWDNDEEPK